MARALLSISILIIAFLDVSEVGFGWQSPLSPVLVSFQTKDGGLIYANLYGNGKKGVVLAHGGRFNKESWDAQARELANAGYCVLAIDFRGYGKSKGPGDSDVMSAPLYQDVLAAVGYLHKGGARRGVSW